MKNNKSLFKKYGAMYPFALLGLVILTLTLWPVCWFILFMFKDEKDPDKQVVLKRLEIVTKIWTVFFFVALIAGFISYLFNLF